MNIRGNTIGQHGIELRKHGKEALEIVRINNYKLIPMDIQMRDMGGFEVTKAIREKEMLAGGHMPIIASTAYGTDEDRQKCMNAGMDEFLNKPLDIQKFYDTVDKWRR